MEEIALRRNIQVRNHADLRVIDIHNRKLGRASISPQSRVINRPVRLIEAIIRVGVGVHIRDERDEPVLHVLGDGGVVDACEVLSLALRFSHRVQGKGMQYLTRRVVRKRDEHSRRAVRLGAGVEDELVSRDAHVAHRAGHVVRRTIDDEVAEEGLALPESAVKGIGRV